MALGAKPRSVSTLIVREAGVLVAVGLVLGLGGAVAAATIMRGVLFQTAPWDVPTLAAVVSALGCSALVASYIPARRAAAINPIDALRGE
jgi:ABC-type antimicrobial peptide transport system permease subunit